MAETTPEDATIPLVVVRLSLKQSAMVVSALMEQSRHLSTPEQIEWSRLAIGINDLIVEKEHEPAEPQ